MNSVHYSSATDDWATPAALFAQLNVAFGFTLDPCASVKNAKCARYFARRQDGLKQEWLGHRVFMNPPYGREIGAWVKKAHETAMGGGLVICLLPSRTDTAWWHNYCAHYPKQFLRGRLCFNDGAQPAPFPSVLVFMLPPFGRTKE